MVMEVCRVVLERLFLLFQFKDRTSVFPLENLVLRRLYPFLISPVQELILRMQPEAEPLKPKVILAGDLLRLPLRGTGGQKVPLLDRVVMVAAEVAAETAGTTARRCR